MTAALALIRRDIALAFREGGAIGVALGFYLVVIAIAPFGLGPDLNLLSRVAPGLLWVALLLAALLSADRIFHNDYEDGTLDVLTMGPLPPADRGSIKSLAHWITTCVPLALLASHFRRGSHSVCPFTPSRCSSSLCRGRARRRLHRGIGAS